LVRMLHRAGVRGQKKIKKKDPDTETSRRACPAKGFRTSRLKKQK